MQERLRNVGIVAHIDAGKTTLTERILYYAGRIHSMREVRGGDGGATMDSNPIERRRGITIQAAATRVEWQDHWINIIDTPGHVDFTIEVERSLRVLDGALLVLCAKGGVQSQTQTVYRQMQRYRTPHVAVINKMDLTGADGARVIEQLRTKLDVHPVALQLPYFSSGEFAGVVDLITMEQVTFESEDGSIVARRALKEGELWEQASAARTSMLEAVGLVDERLMETLLSGNEADEEQIHDAIRRATLGLRMVPVVFGSATRNQGVQPALDAAVRYLPSPEEREVTALDLQDETSTIQLTCDDRQPLVAMAFKTIVDKFGQLTYLRVYQGQLHKGDQLRNARSRRKIRVGRLLRVHADQTEDIEHALAGDIVAVMGIDCATGDTLLGEGASCALESLFVPDPVVSLAIEVEDRADRSKLAKALERLRREDPTFHVANDETSGETLVSGMGRLHLEVAIERIRDEFDCNVQVGTPQVAYRQRPTKAVDFDFTLSKQTGGPGTFARIVGRMEPLPADSELNFEFESQISGGRIPAIYIPAIERGFRELGYGPLGSFETVGVRIVLQDGAFHEKDSSEFAFEACARTTLHQQILPQAEMVLLEPMMKLEVEVPAEFQGPVTAHLGKIRAMVLNTLTQAGTCVLSAEAPLAELFDYANDLRTLTKGNGTFTMQVSHYAQANAMVQSAFAS